MTFVMAGKENSSAVVYKMKDICVKDFKNPRLEQGNSENPSDFKEMIQDDIDLQKYYSRTKEMNDILFTIDKNLNTSIQQYNNKKLEDDIEAKKIILMKEGGLYKMKKLEDYKIPQINNYDKTKMQSVERKKIQNIVDLQIQTILDETQGTQLEGQNFYFNIEKTALLQLYIIRYWIQTIEREKRYDNCYRIKLVIVKTVIKIISMICTLIRKKEMNLTLQLTTKFMNSAVYDWNYIIQQEIEKYDTVSDKLHIPELDMDNITMLGWKEKFKNDTEKTNIDVEYVMTFLPLIGDNIIIRIQDISLLKFVLHYNGVLQNMKQNNKKKIDQATILVKVLQDQEKEELKNIVESVEERETAENTEEEVEEEEICEENVE